MIHRMTLYDEPFEMIKKRSKTIELRLNDQKRKLIKVDDLIIFTNLNNNDEITCKVIKIYLLSNFEELYQALPLNKCGYNHNNINQAKPSDMLRYYSEEKQNKYGVLGIELNLMKDDNNDISQT